MYAIVVEFEIASQHWTSFLPLMATNAAASLRDEQDCIQFDICTDTDLPNQVFLYEVYSNEQAFADHLQSPHFKEFDAAVSHMITRKTVRSFREVIR